MCSLTHLRPSPTAYRVSEPPLPNRKSPVVVAMATNKDNPGDTKRVAVVGAGVSGLAAAHKLKSLGVAVTLFEADKRAGGKIRTMKQDGLIWDEGANTMTEGEREVTDLIDDLGLRDQLQMPIAQNKRYVARNGSPLLLPSGPVSLLKSNILSAKSKLKIALEPFLGSKGEASKVADEHSFESVGEFFERHFGREFVDYLIDPFLAGTCAGDPVSVSMRHAFPELWNIEKRFDSVILGAIRSKLASRKEKSKETKSSSRQRGSFSFQGGMQTLIDTICNEFSEDELKLQAKVLSLAYSDDQLSNMQKWSVSSTSNSMQDQPFDAIVMTAPISHVKEMKISRRGNPFSLNFLPEVEVELEYSQLHQNSLIKEKLTVDYLPLSVIITTFKKANVRRPLEGFGVLIPSKEQKNGLNTLGTLFSSMMFPDRAPSDVHLYTTFVGGSRNRELAKASTEELKQIVSSDLQQLLGTEGEPTFIHHCFWSRAFPLYGRSYDSVLNAITKMESDLPGFFYAGNHKDGLSVGKAIASGYKAADLVISYLNSYPLEKMAEEASAS